MMLLLKIPHGYFRHNLALRTEDPDNASAPADLSKKNEKLLFQ